jgi:hypothetical protein
MNPYTDQFETILPAEARKCFQVPPQPPIQLKFGWRKPLSIIDKGFGLVIVICMGFAIFVASAIWNENHPSQEELNARKAGAIAQLRKMTEYTPTALDKIFSTPVALATPFPFQAAPTPQATPEVRRAELVPSDAPIVLDTVLAHMPDGEIISARILGSVVRQENLPLAGNRAGDAYVVNGTTFVWTRLTNGQGMWIDPVID